MKNRYKDAPPGTPDGRSRENIRKWKLSFCAYWSDRLVEIFETEVAQVNVASSADADEFMKIMQFDEAIRQAKYHSNPVPLRNLYPEIAKFIHVVRKQGETVPQELILDKHTHAAMLIQLLQYLWKRAYRQHTRAERNGDLAIEIVFDLVGLENINETDRETDLELVRKARKNIGRIRSRFGYPSPDGRVPRGAR